MSGIHLQNRNANHHAYPPKERLEDYMKGWVRKLPAGNLQPRRQYRCIQCTAGYDVFFSSPGMAQWDVMVTGGISRKARAVKYAGRAGPLHLLKRREDIKILSIC